MSKNVSIDLDTFEQMQILPEEVRLTIVKMAKTSQFILRERSTNNILLGKIGPKHIDIFASSKDVSTDSFFLLPVVDLQSIGYTDEEDESQEDYFLKIDQVSILNFEQKYEYLSSEINLSKIHVLTEEKIESDDLYAVRYMDSLILYTYLESSAIVSPYHEDFVFILLQKIEEVSLVLELSSEDKVTIFFELDGYRYSLTKYNKGTIPPESKKVSLRWKEKLKNTPFSKHSFILKKEI